MSMSVSAFSGVVPNAHSISNVSATNDSDPLGDLLKSLDDTSDTASVPLGANSPVSAYDATTLGTLISAQGESGDGALPTLSFPGSTGGTDTDTTPPDDNGNVDAASSATQTVSNPDGSITTTVTNIDGSQTVNTTAPQPDVATLASDLQKLQTLLTPAAETLMLALLI